MSVKLGRTFGADVGASKPGGTLICVRLPGEPITTYRFVIDLASLG